MFNMARREACKSYSHSNQRSEIKPTRTRSVPGMSQHCQRCPIKAASRFSSSKVGCFMSDGGWTNIHQFIALRSIENTVYSYFFSDLELVGKDRYSFHSLYIPLFCNLSARLFKMNSTHLGATTEVSLSSTNALTATIH